MEADLREGRQSVPAGEVITGRPGQPGAGPVEGAGGEAPVGHDQEIRARIAELHEAVRVQDAQGGAGVRG